MSDTQPDTAASESDADVRARQIEEQMTDDERFSLVISLLGAVPALGVPRDKRIPDEVMDMSAGYTPGVPRLGVPAIQSSDASMGVTNPGYRPDDKGATAFPASILIGASFNPRLAREGGAAIGREARMRGFNVQLAGGINLARDPRNGRAFEYYSEDPFLSAVLGAEAVNGIQSEGVISTLKHYTLNCNETNRHWLDAIIDPDAHRESDLLAFQIAIERSQPGSIMSGYNKINGEYAGGNNHLLNEVLKGAWGYPGYVMSDWGAVPEWDYALKGLDQESGIQMDVHQWGSEAFTDRLRAAYADGKLPKERLSEMVRRILRSLFAVGADNWGPAPEVDLARHNEIALEAARQGIVLLKNHGALPLGTDKPLKIAVIGGHAQEGVPSGTGSGAVMPVGGFASRHQDRWARRDGGHAQSVPVPALAARGAHQGLAPGADRLRPRIHTGRGHTARRALRRGHRIRNPRLGRSLRQRRPVPAVRAGRGDRRRRRRQPQHDRRAWRPATRSPCPGAPRSRRSCRRGTPARPEPRRSPRSSPARPTPPAGCPSPSRKPEPDPATPAARPGHPWGTPTTIEYTEGAEIGYRWFAKTGATPIYAFGHG
jgi:beta-glucosidase